MPSLVYIFSVIHCKAKLTLLIDIFLKTYISSSFLYLITSSLGSTDHSFGQGCGSGSGSGRIRNVFLGSESGVIIPDPDPANIKTNFLKQNKMLFQQRLLLKILIKFLFFRHNFDVFAGGDAITNMIMTRHPLTLVGSGSVSAIRNKKFGSGSGINHFGSATLVLGTTYMELYLLHTINSVYSAKICVPFPQKCSSCALCNIL